MPASKDQKVYVVTNRGPVAIKPASEIDCLFSDKNDIYTVGAGGLAVGFNSLLKSGVPISIFSLPMTDGDHEIINGEHEKVLEDCRGIEGIPNINVEGVDSRSLMNSKHVSVKISHEDFIFYNNFLNISKKQKENHYNGWSNGILWPFFHYFSNEFQNHNFPDLTKVKPKSGWNLYKAYQRTNSDMARFLANSVTGENETVLINDYQMMLVAQYLPEELDLSKGYFHHITVPPAQRTREMLNEINPLVARWVKDCLAGPLHCDYAAFHVPEWRDNYVYSVDMCLDSIQTEFLGEEEGWLVTHPFGRCFVGNVPMGIDYDSVSKQARGSLDTKVETAEGERKLEELIDKEYLNVGSMGRLDYTKGDRYLLQIMEEMDKLYQHNSDLQDKLSEVGKSKGPFLYQVGQPSRMSKPEYKKLMSDVYKESQEVNEKAIERGKTEGLCRFLDKGLPAPYSYRFQAAMDIMFVPTLADGQNLVALESIASKDHLPRGQRGIIAIGNNSGAAKTLYNAGLREEDGIVYVDPTDIKGSAERVFEAYMKYSVSDRALNVVKSMPVENWFSGLNKKTEASHRYQL